jgi:aminoacylase
MSKRGKTAKKFKYEHDESENPSVTLFREYLRIKTVHPTPDFTNALKFLKQVAKDLGLENKTFSYVKGKPIFLMTWPGKKPELGSILLVSHMDVVPVEPEKWTYDPFAAHKDEKGNIYARGTQDMKSVGIQYIEAIRKLKQANEAMVRTIHLAFMPDEEIGGGDGMKKFIEQDDFKKLNVAMALDEGLASPNEVYTVFYGERAAWWVQIYATGNTGHGSRFIESSAVEKLMTIVNKLLQFRKEQFEELQKGMAKCGMKLGDVTTVNLTVLQAGVTTDHENFSINVVPGKAMAAFDIRIPPSVNLEQFKKQLDEWTNIEGVSYELKNEASLINKSTPLNDNIWWKIFKETSEKIGIKLDPQIFPAATDSRYLRSVDVPALGFSPMNMTPILLHDHNEFLNEGVFLKGIEIYVALIPPLANYDT